LTATLPLYLGALTESGAHVATANDYLAERDARELAPLYDLLGLNVGVVQSNSTPVERQRAYRRDVTYTTIKEIGFDFLRDRLAERRISDGSARLASLLGQEELIPTVTKVHREFQLLLVDEADNILIDEARTPLIVSALPNRAADHEAQLYRWAATVVPQFRDDDVRIEKSGTPTLLERGRRKVRELVLPESLRSTPLPDLYEFVQRAIHVDRHYVRDRHYVVRDEKVVIVDEYTGRLAEGRQWRTGLHQAIEAREGLEISVATGEAARVTVQDLCLRYPRLCGMTGTVASSGRELLKIYRLHSIGIPTHLPSRREAWPEMVFADDDQKWDAIVREAHAISAGGRPVLIGTRSIDKSERLSVLLHNAQVKHVVLNARHLAQEAEIIAQAGAAGQVTVATNMAGRGTDIRLDAKATERGGLHVMVSELHDSARIDRQLIGRCGRQGDPGSYRQFLSIDDDILAVGLGKNQAKRLKRRFAGAKRPLQHVSAYFYRAQRRVERNHFEARKILLYRERHRQDLQRQMGQDHYLDTLDQ
jgi:preprotein translocase subunit SecA